MVDLTDKLGKNGLGGMEHGKEAGITLCQILNCLETNRLLPSQNHAPLCT